jgi:hypothetical protein
MDTLNEFTRAQTHLKKWCGFPEDWGELAGGNICVGWFLAIGIFVRHWLKISGSSRVFKKAVLN